MKDSFVVLAMMIIVSAGGVAQVPDSAPRAQVLLRRDIAAAIPQLQKTISLQLEGASLDEALQTVAHQAELPITYNDAILPRDRKVWLTASEIRTDEALEEILRDSGLQLLPLASGQVVVVKARAQGGTVTGRVTDGKSGKGIPNVSVFLEGTRWRATTGEDGSYRLVEVTAGTYTLTASRIGYAKQSQSVTVAAGQEVTADVALRAAATELEQVVVTGTVVPTERKAIPTPISVITADEIEQKGYQRVDQIFRGDIPGAIALDLGAFNYATDISIRGANSLTGTYVKTYIDGVEVADPANLAMIDPSTIERIEVLRGPQGSTIYGSDAAGGVMQIFTKKGAFNAAHPQIAVKVSGGLIESRWNNAAQQDHSLAVSGGGPDFSYRLGAGFLQYGDWVSHVGSRNASVYGGMRETQGPVIAELSARFYASSFGFNNNPDFATISPALASIDQPYLAKQQTYGLTFRYAPTPRWQHTVVLGYDRNALDNYLNAPRYRTPADSFLFVSSFDETKTSVAYNTTAELPLGRAVRSLLTAGADHWTYHSAGFYADQVTQTNNLSAPGSGFRYQYDNTGYFAQGQLGVWDALFVTAGLRAEDNQNFGKDFGLAWAPRVGVSYVRTVGDLTAKARVAYGKGIRPPPPGSARTIIYPGCCEQLGNPNLGPVQQVGPDGGFDLYFGRRASLEVTYYHQSAKDLIAYVQLSDAPVNTYQYQNVGEIQNKGWEFQGRLNAGRASLTGTYSIVSSVVEKLSPSYSGDLQAGDQIMEIPKHTAGATLAYSLPRAALTLGMTYVGSRTGYDYVALFSYFYGLQPYRGSFRNYWTTYPGFAKVNLSVTQTVSDHLSLFLRSDNLTNNNVSEVSNYWMNMGRVTLVGVRVKG